MFGILDYLKIGGGFVLGAALVFYPARWIGQGEGKQMAATAALSKSVTLLRERNVVNDQVSTADASSLCADFGLSDSDQAECVRRLQPTNSKPDNVANDPSNGSAICQPGRSSQKVRPIAEVLVSTRRAAVHLFGFIITIAALVGLLTLAWNSI